MDLLRGDGEKSMVVGEVRGGWLGTWWVVSMHNINGRCCTPAGIQQLSNTPLHTQSYLPFET